jgi:hypothetical protein
MKKSFFGDIIRRKALLLLEYNIPGGIGYKKTSPVMTFLVYFA